MNEIKMQDILAEYAEGLVDNRVTVEDLIKKYNIKPGSDLEALLRVAEMLESVLVRVQPSSQFVNELRHELIGDAKLLARLRQIPGLRMAAGIAGISGLTVAAAGVLWWVHRAGVEKRRQEALAS